MFSGEPLKIRILPTFYGHSWIWFLLIRRGRGWIAVAAIARAGAVAAAVTVSPDMLCRMQSEILFGNNPNHYVEWVGTVECYHPIRIIPTPHETWYGNGDQTIWPYRLSTWLHGRRTVKWCPRQSIIEILLSNCSEKQPSSRFCLNSDWHSLLWISAHGRGIITIFITYHFYLIFKKSHHLFNLGVKEVICYLPRFPQVLLNFSMVNAWISSLWFCIYFTKIIFVWKASTGYWL
jgi:hypothetical protein